MSCSVSHASFWVCCTSLSTVSESLKYRGTSIGSTSSRRSFSCVFVRCVRLYCVSRTSSRALSSVSHTKRPAASTPK